VETRDPRRVIGQLQPGAASFGALSFTRLRCLRTTQHGTHAGLLARARSGTSQRTTCTHTHTHTHTRYYAGRKKSWSSKGKVPTVPKYPLARALLSQAKKKKKKRKRKRKRKRRENLKYPNLPPHHRGRESAKPRHTHHTNIFFFGTDFHLTPPRRKACVCVRACAGALRRACRQIEETCQ
jgi:hypothetical protein